MREYTDSIKPFNQDLHERLFCSTEHTQEQLLGSLTP